MKGDFRINGNEVGSNNVWYGLHNRFRFMGYSWDTNIKLLCLSFTPIEEWKIESDEGVIFAFQKVDFFTKYSLGKEKCFEEIGYKYPSDFEYDWFLTEEESDSSDHLIFWFEDNGYIRVHSQNRMLITERDFESSDEFNYAVMAFGY